MKRIIPAFMLALFISPSQASAAQYRISFSDGSQGSSHHAGPNRYAMKVRVRWIGMTREFALGEHYGAGLGLHLGGTEIAWRTTDSPVTSGALSIDLNDWLSARAKLRFHELVPYAQLSYHRGNFMRGLAFRVDAGMRLLSVSDLSLEIDGPLASEIRNRGALLRDFEQQARDELDDYYLEPVLRMDLSYRFG